jgi:hypothetical protein
MVTEIADSDGESELGSPARAQQFSPKHLPETQEGAASTDLGVRFSDFLSQEQQLREELCLRSSNSQRAENHSQLGLGEAVTGNDDDDDGPAQKNHLLEDALTAVHVEIVRPEPATTKTTPTSRKRRHTTRDDGATGLSQTSQKRQRKSRAQTYGGKSDGTRSGQTQIPNDQEDPAWRVDHGPTKTGCHVSPSNDPNGTADTSYLSISMQPPTTSNSRALEEEDESARLRYRSRRGLGLIEESMPGASREISTSRSSIGNYESINIDFRGSATGLDVDANPFGSITQTSADDGVDDADREEIASESGLDGVNTGALWVADNLGPSRISEDLRGWKEADEINGGGLLQMPESSRSIDPMLLYNDLPPDTQLLSSPKSSPRKSPKIVPRTSMSPAVKEDGLSINRSASDNALVNGNSTTKKGDRKLKSQQFVSRSPGPLQEEHSLNSDEPTVELPQDQYAPSPSRSQGITNEMLADPASADAMSEAQETNESEQGLPVKQLTSELNLSDEAFVGLPKENYKPRPSRSRSKKTMVDNGDTVHSDVFPAVEEPPMRSAAIIVEAEEATTKKLKKLKKPLKKTKVKRAKTSASALIKKSEPMLSEGEDDVLWLETKPNQVKLDVPRSIKPETAVGGEELGPVSAGSTTIEAAVETGVAELENPVEEWHNPVAGGVLHMVDAAGVSSTSDSRYESVTRTDTSHILVDIPPLSTGHIQHQPKKRGRKKNSSEVPIDQVIYIGEHGHGPESSRAAANGALDEVSVLARPETKKGGRKEEAADMAAEAEHVNQNAESESDASFSEENQHGHSRPVLAAKHPNCTVPLANFKSVKHNPSDSANGVQSPGKENRLESAASPLETPHKQGSKDTDSQKGPTKHSPINPSGGKAVYRVGLSKRAVIPPLLKIVRKDIDNRKEVEKAKRKPQTETTAANEE